MERVTGIEPALPAWKVGVPRSGAFRAHRPLDSTTPGTQIDSIRIVPHGRGRGRESGMGGRSEAGRRRVSSWAGRRTSVFGALLTVMLASSACGISAASAAPAVVPIPPFHACPAVGASPSCQIFLVVNPDATVSVWGDPSVGPYDGSDDTLVGVRNDSAQSVDAITVTGPGSGLGGLDGDGLCTFGVAGCPFGVTGYEGPGTRLVTDPALPDAAEVDFTGSLAPGASTFFSLEGALTAAQLTSRQGHLKGIQDYVALGDSYSSGEGAAFPIVTYRSDISPDPSTFTSDNRCHRSDNSYPQVLKRDLAVPTFKFWACSGALLSEMTNQLNKDNNNPLKKKYSGQWNEPAQLDHIASATGSPDPNVDLVTLSIGGNDAGFVDALKACIHGFAQSSIFTGFANSNCTMARLQSKMNQAVESFKDGKREIVWSGGTWQECAGCALGPRRVSVGPLRFPDRTDGYVVDVPSLNGLYRQIHNRAPNAKIRVVGYPYLFGAGNSTVRNNRACLVGSKFGQEYWLTKQDLDNFHAFADQLDDTIRDQVAITRSATPGLDIQFVDMRPAFSGHGLCDSQTSWINGLLPTGSPTGISEFSFHPDAIGQQRFEAAVKGSL